ncbi:MAG: hypothetical protein EKK48_04285 [Candidatus Melainabacteria bacterium]|nr:MAG: hypothetical protein EKK48_04285 [Candidatus Melainabacteria bacterium]
MAEKTQYNIVTCAEPTWKAFEFAAKPSLNRILDAFELSDFAQRTKYNFVNFFIQIDGFSPGKEDTVFHDLPDIHYKESRTENGNALWVSLKIKREDWIDIAAPSQLEHLFFCKLFLAGVHACRYLRLNYRGLLKLLETQVDEVDRRKIQLELRNLDTLTYNRRVAKQKNELEVEFEMTETTNYYTDPRPSWRLEDAIDEHLQATGLGYVEGHEVGNNVFTVFCNCYDAPNKALTALKDLPMTGWQNVQATLITAKEYTKVQIK